MGSGLGWDGVWMHGMGICVYACILNFAYMCLLLCAFLRCMFACRYTMCVHACVSSWMCMSKCVYGCVCLSV